MRRTAEETTCEFADRNFANQTHHDLGPVSDTLTIDNPHEIDWIRSGAGPLPRR